MDLEIEDGEFAVLVGPSGCGKSTALRIIAGLEDPSVGRVLIGGRDVTAVSPQDRDIAMVFQDYALYPHMTVLENIAFGLVMRRMPRAESERRVRDVAAMLGLGELLGRRPRELSGGQRQRVALGRAIVRQPSVFLFDEPLSNLDAALRVEMRAELSRLHDRLRTTSVFVTHDQVEAMTMGSKIVVMRDGRIQQAGPPLQVYHQPANRFVAGFIGSPRMNFLDGRLVEDGQGMAVLCGELRVPVPRSKVAAWRAHLGQPVTLGLRPGDIHDPGSSRPGTETHRVEAEVAIVEPLGSETHVHARIGTHEVVAVLGPSVRVRLHERVPLVLDIGRMHLFATTGDEARLAADEHPDAWAA
jgi:multiple sugar transport system ATP-binding protein